MAQKETIGEVILLNVRLSFADLFKPGRPMTGDDGKPQPGRYKANLLISKTNDPHGNMAKLRQAAIDAKTAAWGPEANWPKMKANQLCVRNGDEENWDGYEGMFYVSASNQNPPVLVDSVKDQHGKWKVLTIENGGMRKLYAGAYVNAVVRLWGQKSRQLPGGQTIPNRVNASLESVQFWRDGDAFSGGKPVDPNEKFADVQEQGEAIGGSEDAASSLI